MEVEIVKVSYDGKIHQIVKYHLSQKDRLLNDSLETGAELAGKVNIKDPAGVPRDVATRVAKCSGGVIAERIFKNFMQKRMVEEEKTRRDLSRVELYTPPGDYSRGQVDLIIRKKVDKTPLVNMEIRSSFSYITRSIFNVVRYAMSLLGPYTTLIKPDEELKDFYVTVIHRIEPWFLLERSRNEGIDSYIVGGGTKEMFQDSRLTRVDDLYQEGASYKIIKPMWKGLDAFSLAERIIAKTLKRLAEE